LTPHHLFRDPFNAPYYKLSNYVIPSEKKRDDLIYQVRMKLAQASALTFERPFNCDAQKGKTKPTGKKRPVSAYAKVTARIDSNIKNLKVR
jgi:hypothetical protein